MNFNDNWRFIRETAGPIVNAEKPGFDDSSWRELNLPHDWSIELDFNPESPATHEGGFLDGGIGWYRKTFTIPSSLKNERIFINFDGVYMNSTTYINGYMMGTYPFGYNGFEYDITDQIKYDEENTIAVKVDNTQPSSRWYSGSGIYRNVKIEYKNPIHVARHGTFITTPDLENAISQGQANVNIETKVDNNSSENCEIKVKSCILDKQGEVITTVQSDIKTVTPGVDVLFKDQTIINNPTLWDIDQPYRYKLITEVIADGKTVDTHETPFGVRFFDFDANEGFSLNGKYMKLHGVCMHHDLGALGAATNARAVERQMEIMKEMGVNAIRVSHNPASPELLEACNNLGLLVVEESFDCWSLSKKQYDYGRFFNEWAEHDTKEMVHRGKNEPSIIMWSIGNEIYDTTSENGVKIAKNLVRWVKEIDTTRPTTIGEDKTRGDKVNITELDPHIKEIFDTVDLVGFNYSENNYQGYHDMHPEWKLYGAETSSATRSRGVYTHPYDYNSGTTYDDLQQSSYDNDYVAWGRTAEDAWKADRDLKHIAGQFIWTGFDYIGEPTPYYDTFPAKSSYFGAVDTAGFPKDIFYYYQSQWTKEPMVHLLPHWNWDEGETVRVLAYTNMPEVELILNGKSIGTRKYQSKTTSWGASYYETENGQTYLEWDVPFEAGTLEAIARDDNGTIIAKDKVITAGKPHAIKLTADRRVIDADGHDVSFVTIEVVDKEGFTVPTADHLINFDLSGAGTLAGVDNGDGASIERYKDNHRTLFNGKALAILKAEKHAGEIILEASSVGLKSDRLTVFTHHTSDANTTEIVGVEAVELVTDLNQEPELPETVTAFYNDGSEKAVKVSWNRTHSESYSRVGKFDIEGQINKSDVKAKAVITVKDVIAIKPFSTVVKPGKEPKLPTEVTLFYSDGTTVKSPVSWDHIPTEELIQTGQLTTYGHAEKTSIRPEAHIRVSKDEQANATAKLNSVMINGELLADFDSHTTHYDITLPYGSSVPMIEARATDHATTVSLAPLTLPGVAVLIVTSEDQQTEKKYALNIRTEEPALIAAELVVEATNITEDDTVEIRVNGKFEDGRQVDITKAAVIDYNYDEEKVKIDNHILFAYNEGNVSVYATVTYRGVTINSPETHFIVARNPVEKHLESLESVTIITNQKETPTLPEKVIAHYDNGLPREIIVEWDNIGPGSLQEVGAFIVHGSVVGTDLKAEAKIIIKGVVAVEEITLAILVNQTPELPKTVNVFYSDGSEESNLVKWDQIDLDIVRQVGSFTLNGVLEGLNLQTIAHVRVTDQIGKQQNVGRAKNGYNYPKAYASFTNCQTDSKDQVEAIHDDVISYKDEPHNRWTNWQPGESRERDWVAITFGDYGPEAYFVDQVEIHWFENDHVSFPEDVTIQYKSGDEWIDVQNLTTDFITPQVEKANTYRFDMIKTTDIRLNMIAQTDKAIGITEMKVFSKWPIVHTEPVLTEILHEGNNIIDQFEKVGENFITTIEVSDPTTLPRIEAYGENNTNITTIPAQAAPSTTRVIAKAEDGKKVTEYHINFIVK